MLISVVYDFVVWIVDVVYKDLVLNEFIELWHIAHDRFYLFQEHTDLLIAFIPRL